MKIVRGQHGERHRQVRGHELGGQSLEDDRGAEQRLHDHEHARHDRGDEQRRVTPPMTGDGDQADRRDERAHEHRRHQPMRVLDPGVEVGRGDPVAEAERPVRASQPGVRGAHQTADGDQDERGHGGSHRQLGESGQPGSSGRSRRGGSSGRSHDSDPVHEHHAALSRPAATIGDVSDGRLLHVNVSAGGVPKRPVDAARIEKLGVEGDRQQAATVHGGPHRAVSILGVEAIRRIAAEGHPIAPGTTGENLTTEGFDVSTLPVGTRLEIGDEVLLELSGAANPCRTIRHSFADLRFGRLAASAHPADSRMYARVLREGTVRPGDPIRLEAPTGDAAERHRIAVRLDDAERSSTLALWESAARAGAAVALVDDGEIAICAAPQLPGPIFNLALGFASLPNLLDVARDHFERHRTTGWVWSDADAPPWPGAILDATAAYAARADGGRGRRGGNRGRHGPGAAT